MGKITAAVVKHYGGRRGMRGDEYREILTTLAGDVFIGLDTIIAAVKHAGENRGAKYCKSLLAHLITMLFSLNN